MESSYEKRKYRRIKSDYQIILDMESEMGIGRLEEIGQVVNISLGGILFKYKKPLEKELIISLRFVIKGSYNVTSEYTARVVRIESSDDNMYDIGIEFLGLSPEQEKELEKILISEDV